MLVLFREIVNFESANRAIATYILAPTALDVVASSAQLGYNPAQLGGVEEADSLDDGQLCALLKVSQDALNLVVFHSCKFKVSASATPRLATVQAIKPIRP